MTERKGFWEGGKKDRGERVGTKEKRDRKERRGRKENEKGKGGRKR